MIQLKTLLKLQVVYYLLGIAYNAVSYYFVVNFGYQLAPNEPVAGSLFMTLYASFLITGFKRKLGIYTILMWASVLLLGYGGVINNVIRMINQPELFYSIPVGIIGSSINVFGLFLNLIAALKRYRN